MARAYDRILKVARITADRDHVSKAIGFRALDRQLWR
jgi:predicted ATPase with chaperone activity